MKRKDFEFVAYETMPRIGIVTLNDPQRANCLSVGMRRDIEAALGEASRDDGVRVIIIKGAGRGFCAGYDLGQYPRAKSLEVSPRQMFETVQALSRNMAAIRDVPKPTIAQVHGFAVAGGSMVAAMCDLCIIAEDAKVGVPQGGPMAIPGLIGAHWGRLVGTRKIREFEFIIGYLMTGKEAQAVGFANKAVPADKLESETLELARRMAKTPLENLMLSKMAANAMVNMRGDDAFAFGWLISYVAEFTPAVRSWIAEIGSKGWKEAAEEWHKTEGRIVGLSV